MWSGWTAPPLPDIYLCYLYLYFLSFVSVLFWYLYFCFGVLLFLLLFVFLCFPPDKCGAHLSNGWAAVPPHPPFFLLYNCTNRFYKQKTNGTLFVPGFKTLAGGLWGHGQQSGAKMVSGEWCSFPCDIVVSADLMLISNFIIWRLILALSDNVWW